MPPSYESLTYWTTRFTKEPTFDWLLPRSTAKGIISTQRPLVPHGGYLNTLHIGCGNSRLTRYLSDECRVYTACSVTHVDFSTAGIEAGKAIAEADHAGEDPTRAVPYFLSSKYGTPIAVWDAYLESIGKKHSDGPIGRLEGGLSWQGQALELTRAQAEDVRSQPFMDFVVVVDERDFIVWDENSKDRPPVREDAVRWVVADLLSLDDVNGKLLLSPLPGGETAAANAGSYHLIVDKSTTDSIACGDDVALTLPYPPSDSDPKLQGARVNIHPIHLLTLHLALLAPQEGSRWLVFSYSNDRFPFLADPASSKPVPYQKGVPDGPLNPAIQRAGFPDTGRLWRVEKKWSIDTGKRDAREGGKEKGEGKGKVYRPPELCWVYVLVRTGVSARAPAGGPGGEGEGDRRRCSSCTCL